MTDVGPIIFVASTCYDLTDLRAELKADLEKDGFIVKLSDDWASAFKVNTSVDSIESCLENLRSSDAALFIFDRRHGPPVPGDEENRSATHIEFDYATEMVLKNDFRRFTFVRKSTWLELGQWEADNTFAPDWVQRGRHKELFELIRKAKGLRRGEPGSNWVDQFETSLDLKQIARKRLYDEFPAQAGGRALTRDRVARLTFLDMIRDYGATGRAGLTIQVSNAGLNVAVDLEVLVALRGKPLRHKHYISVLPVGAATKTMNFILGSGVSDYHVVCDYGNLWGDRYKVSTSLIETDKGNVYFLGEEKFRVVKTGM